MRMVIVVVIFRRGGSGSGVERGEMKVNGDGRWYSYSLWW